MKNNNFVVVAHAFHAVPQDDLVAYLNAGRPPNVLLICHSFSDASDRRSFYHWYRHGILVQRKQTRDYRWLPEPLIYLKELLFTLYWVIRAPFTGDRYIGVDGLCSLFGLMLRAIGKVRCVNYWNIDLVPSGRFPKRWKDAAYRLVNRFSSLHADEMWDLTDLMVREKERVLGLRPADYRSHRVVPIGVWTDRIRRYRYEDCEQHTLVFMGHLLEKQGVQLVLEAIPRIVERVPNFRFKIIGAGAYEGHLRLRAEALDVESHVSFLGRIQSDEDMEREVTRCCAGIAPYVRSLDTFTQFGSDPGKIKTYLACGIPILLTDVPWIAREIETRGCGQIISEDLNDIAAKVTHLLADGQANQACRDNAATFAMEFGWRSIFDRLGL